MVVCKFFLQGNCRYGDRCRNEHPRSDNRFNAFDGTADQLRSGSLFSRVSGPDQAARQQGRPQFQAQGQFQQPPPQRDRSPFERPFQSRGQGRGQLYQPPGQRDRSPRNQQDDIDPNRPRHEYYRPQYRLEEEHLIEDLRDARPEWPLSAYAGHQNAPKDLINANLEFSPEEVRFGVYLAQASGKLDAALQEEVRLAMQVNQQVQAILADRRGAIRYVVNGRNEHPNRWDVINDCNKTGLTPDYLLSNQEPKDPFVQQQSTELTPSAFAQQQPQQQQAPPTNQSPFGQPSAFTQNTIPFSQPAFSQPSQTPFGAPSFSQPAQSTFSQPQAAATSAFSQQQQSLPFGATQQVSPFTTTAQQQLQPPVSEPTKIPPNSRLASFLSATGSTAIPATFPDAQPPDSAYGSQTAALQSAFAAAREKDEFPGGVIPEVAPKGDWVTLDWQGNG